MPKRTDFKKYNKKLCVDDGEGGWKLRVYQRIERGVESDRLLVKCGDCHEKIHICYDDTYGMQIEGVFASFAEWRRVLLPLLYPKGDGPELE
ncbi:MAG TPA: hypothetical protein PKN33_00640 [Phycisphaerae bacterium]|nr:hypothetical protein [Phycisphaerae bacterium]